VGLASMTNQLQSVVDLQAYAAEIVGSSPLKIEVIPGFYGKSNSSVIEIILLRTLEGDKR